jgi:monothiol glutaredoxin
MEASIISEQAIAEALDTAISGNRVMLFMKGTPEQPRCGFSLRVVQSLRDVDADFAAMDILPDPRIRQVLSARSGWPTIPQLFVDGTLVGGCDIVVELEESGELAKVVAPAAE